MNIEFGYKTRAGFIKEVDVYNVKSIPEHCITFDFSFDGWITDNCIIYDVPVGVGIIKGYTDWACNKEYQGTNKKTLQRIVDRIIKEYKTNK